MQWDTQGPVEIDSWKKHEVENLVSDSPVRIETRKWGGKTRGADPDSWEDNESNPKL